MVPIKLLSIKLDVILSSYNKLYYVVNYTLNKKLKMVQ